MKKIRQTLSVAALAAFAGLSLTACAQTVPVPVPDSIMVKNQEEHSILVQSTEEVKVVPDMARIEFAVISKGADPKACQEQNSQDLNRVLTFLKESGIGEESIQTSNYGLNPVYDWNNGQEITGYEMSTSITVSDIPISRTGELLSSSVDAGINSISQVSYLSSEYDANYEEALKKAVEAAKVKAGAIAEAGDNVLGKIISVEEYNHDTESRYTSYSRAAKEEVLNAGDSMDVEPGQLSVEARIAVTFEIE